jgi:Zn-dependent protease
MIAFSIVARIKCALVLIIFMLIPLFPITGTIGLFIVIFRPIWFKKLVDNVYADKNDL